MASLKELKGRINSVKSTQKITKAKQMVAAAKLRKAQAPPRPRVPMPSVWARVMASLASKVSGDKRPSCLPAPARISAPARRRQHRQGAVRRPQLQHRQGREAKAMELIAAGKTCQFYLVGKKGRAPIRRDYPKQIAENFDTSDLRNPGFAEAEAIAAQLN
jgi:F-type H+-transporting ATPase subunit gamma